LSRRAAGGVGSAKLLMLSGIGRAEDLRRLGIVSVVNLPGVGENYQDHPLLEGVIFRYKDVMPPRNAGSNAVEATSFIRSTSDRTGPDLQPVLIQLPVLTPALTKTYGAMPPDAFTIAPGLVRPSSRGTVKLASADWRANPLLDAGFLSTDADLAATIRCIEHCRELGRQKAFAKISSGELVSGKALTATELADFARNSTTSYFHPVGTCKMGTDTLAVVDPTLRPRDQEPARVRQLGHADDRHRQHQCGFADDWRQSRSPDTCVRLTCI
jgi:choline dehydrogenase